MELKRVGILSEDFNKIFLPLILVVKDKISLMDVRMFILLAFILKAPFTNCNDVNVFSLQKFCKI